MFIDPVTNVWSESHGNIGLINISLLRDAYKNRAEIINTGLPAVSPMLLVESFLTILAVICSSSSLSAELFMLSSLSNSTALKTNTNVIFKYHTFLLYIGMELIYVICVYN